MSLSKPGRNVSLDPEAHAVHPSPLFQDGLTSLGEVEPEAPLLPRGALAQGEGRFLLSSTHLTPTSCSVKANSSHCVLPRCLREGSHTSHPGRRPFED